MRENMLDREILEKYINLSISCLHEEEMEDVMDMLCDSASHHCSRYTGELTSHLCWAWLAGYWEQVQGLISNREEPLLTLVQYLLRSSQEGTTSSHNITPATQQVNMVFPPLYYNKTA